MKVRTGHVSLQFRDSDAQHTSDIEKVFRRAVDRRWAWVTGTESGPGSGNNGPELMRVAREAGYRPWVPSQMDSGDGQDTDCWVAVRKDLINSDWSEDFLPVIPSSRELYEQHGVSPDENPRWGEKGLVSVQFKSVKLGPVGIAVGHYLTKAQRKGPESVDHGVDRWALNEKLDNEFSEWMEKVGQGLGLAFAAMDRNASDRRNPAEIDGATTVFDELKKWHNTGHGDIDWIATYNKDRRVRALSVQVLDDKEFPLNTDHFPVEAVLFVENLPQRR